MSCSSASLEDFSKLSIASTSSKRGIAMKAVPTHAKAFANITYISAIALRFVTSFVKWSIEPTG